MILAELSDAVLNTIIAGIVSVLLAFLTTLGGLLTIWLKMREDKKETTAKLDKVETNVQKIETATNSMKDRLVSLTDKEAHARGVKEGAEAASVASKLGAVASIEENIEKIEEHTGKVAESVVAAEENKAGDTRPGIG